MTKKINKKNGIIYVAISLALVICFVVGIGVNADQSFKQIFADSLAKIYGIDVIAKLGLDEIIQHDINIGAISGSDVYSDVVFHGKTRLEREVANINIPVQLSATTTDTVTRNIAGQYYFADSMICSNPNLWIWDDNGKFGYSLGVGTTTRKDGFYLNATTSRSIFGLTRFNTTTQDIGLSLFGPIATTTGDVNFENVGSYFDGTGKASSTPFYVSSTTVLVIDVAYDGATSSESFTETPADLTVGAFNLDCIDAVDDRDSK